MPCDSPQSAVRRLGLGRANGVKVQSGILAVSKHVRTLTFPQTYLETPGPYFSLSFFPDRNLSLPPQPRLVCRETPMVVADSLADTIAGV